MRIRFATTLAVRGTLSATANAQVNYDLVSVTYQTKHSWNDIGAAVTNFNGNKYYFCMAGSRSAILPLLVLHADQAMPPSLFSWKQCEDCPCSGRAEFRWTNRRTDQLLANQPKYKRSQFL